MTPEQVYGWAEVVLAFLAAAAFLWGATKSVEIVDSDESASRAEGWTQ
jgi:hypothetical protein